MFEARVGEKEIFSPQRRRVLLRLKVVMYGQRRHKFKRILRFDRGEKVFLPLLVKIRSRFCSRQDFGVSEEGFSAIITSTLSQANFRCRLLNFRLPAPFLQRCEAQVGFLAPFLRRCRPQAGFFGCLSYGRAKALRKNKVLKQ